jgi:hypothetical protein
MRRHKTRNPAQRLRTTVDALPARTRRAMLRGIERNRIIVGAYTDPGSGGICPMLAAHRNGGRTDLASFAIAWDAFTDARRPRLATRREVRTLRSYLEISLLRDEQGDDPLTAVAARIRAERTEVAEREAEPEIRIRRGTGERHRGAELRDRLRWTWMRPSRRYDEFKDLVATAEEQLAGQRAADLPGAPPEPARR